MALVLDGYSRVNNATSHEYYVSMINFRITKNTLPQYRRLSKLNINPAVALSHKC